MSALTATLPNLVDDVEPTPRTEFPAGGVGTIACGQQPPSTVRKCGTPQPLA